MTSTAVVVGAGIAGPVAAMALQRAGIDARIVEAYGTGADGVGAFLTLADNGLAALDVLGIGDAVRGIGMPTRRMVLTSTRRGLRELGAFPMRAHTVWRAELYGLLRDEALRRGIPVEHGKRLTGATEGPDGVRALFADGSQLQADLLVGADGLGSRVRCLIDPQARRPERVGLLNTGGVAAGVAVDADPGDAHFVFGRRCFFGFLAHPDGDVWWFANPPSPRAPESLETDGDAWRAHLLGLFAGEPGPMHDLIRATDRIVPPWDTLDLPRVRRWHTDRMVLVGDAVHAMSPSAGQGASMAIEDGIELARALRDAPEVSAGFAAYEAIRRERVERVVRTGRRNGSGKAQGPVGAWLRDLVLPIVLRRSPSADAWLTDHRIDWDAPAASA